MVARPWREVHADAVARARQEPEILDYGRKGAGHNGVLGLVRARYLAEVRKLCGYARQSDVAALMGVSRPRVSKLESGDVSRTELGTLQSYVAALGGNLRVVADFGETKIELSA